jgi:hypothetical protein
MTDFDFLELNPMERAGTEFMARVINEIRRVAVIEKTTRKLTQQDIATDIGTTRQVINRQMQGFENLTARRIGEFGQAFGWEPYFEFRKPPKNNYFNPLPPSTSIGTRVQQPSPNPFSFEVKVA